jgi:predicted HicB family RNase H-like nuclease
MPPKSKQVLPGKRYPLNMRTTKELRDRVDVAAMASGRSLVQEVEFRLERSFDLEQAEPVRLPERLRRRLAQAAKDNDWSMNTEIVDRLDVSFQLEEREKMIAAAAEAAAKTTGGKLVQLFALQEEKKQRIQILDKLKRGDLGTKTDNVETTAESIARTERQIADLDRLISDLGLAGLSPGTTGSKEGSK